MPRATRRALPLPLPPPLPLEAVPGVPRELLVVRAFCAAVGKRTAKPHMGNPTRGTTQRSKNQHKSGWRRVSRAYRRRGPAYRKSTRSRTGGGPSRTGGVPSLADETSLLRFTFTVTIIPDKRQKQTTQGWSLHAPPPPRMPRHYLLQSHASFPRQHHATPLT